MKIKIKRMEECVTTYKRTGDSTDLIKTYRNFLHKYYQLFCGNNIDLSSYDVRLFLSCHIPNPEIRSNLKSSFRYKTCEIKATVRKVVNQIKFKFRYHTDQEIYAELLIPFLECAEKFKFTGISFEKFIYIKYKFELKRHIDNIQLDLTDNCEWYDEESFAEPLMELNEGEEYTVYKMNNDELYSDSWISGETAGEVFKQLKPHERYILSHYYLKQLTDAQVAAALPFHEKSIHRMRKRLKRYFKKMYGQGKLRAIRL